MRIVITALVSCLPVGAQAAGGVSEISAGLSLQSVGPISPNVERGAAVAGEIKFAPLGAGFLGHPRPAIGFSIATDNAATSFAYAGIDWRAPVGRMWFIDFGFGAAIHDGETGFDPVVDFPRQGKAFLGCRALFRLHGGPGVKLAPRIALHAEFEHLSNANLCGENEGLDNIGLRVSIRL
jgi:lipid A 3-O-deacylase